ncbi:MAG: TonB-dependent receptor [Rikenellaceae bacterium]
MKKLSLLTTLSILATNLLMASVAEPQIDTLIAVDQVSVSTIKQGLNLYRQPVASTIISSKEVENKNITQIKDVSQIVPNLHIPDYGSRTTSSIYIRGLGARIDQPVMGLNVDNVPLLNKNAFDTEVMEIERIEVLRGPQSTLYGRNTMGGVMNIYTLSPFNYQGVRVGAEYSSGNTYKLRASVYSRHSDKLATAVSAYYSSTDGFFENLFTGELCDWEQSFGTRLKVSYRASSGIRVENTTAATVLEQGGYPYKLIDSEAANYNTPSSYDRALLSNGTTAKYQGNGFSLSSITSYQYLDDDMFLDNDFTTDDYFTLCQAIKEHSLTEDIVYRSERNSPYNFLFGAFGFYKNQNMEAPVVFKEYGIDNLILYYVNMYLGTPNGREYKWDEEEFSLNSEFTNRSIGGALYHESRYDNNGWLITAGLRLDYEKATLKYGNFTNSSYSIYYSDGEVKSKPISIAEGGKTSIDFLELLPRLSVLRRIGGSEQSSIYLSISKGYKAGGFNTQMFSDILQQRVMSEFGISASSYDTDEIISYKPEHSWNYEVGSHWRNSDGTLSADLALFYIDCRDQQLTVFPEGETTGRMMTNAGHSRSYGVEAALAARLSERLNFNASYGYTNAKFIEYISGTDNYAGNFVPYAPQHTLYSQLSYTQPTSYKFAEKIRFEINGSAAGKIYWNEDNSRSQPFYALLGTSVSFEQKKLTLSLWAKNILQEEYNTFYFMSMQREFVQSGRPRTIGATLTINL